MNDNMIFEIPNRLREPFLSLLEISTNDLIADFGGELTKSEVEVVELCYEFIATERAKQKPA